MCMVNKLTLTAKRSKLQSRRVVTLKTPSVYQPQCFLNITLEYWWLLIIKLLKIKLVKIVWKTIKMKKIIVTLNLYNLVTLTFLETKDNY